VVTIVVVVVVTVVLVVVVVVVVIVLASATSFRFLSVFVDEDDDADADADARGIGGGFFPYACPTNRPQFASLTISSMSIASLISIVLAVCLSATEREGSDADSQLTEYRTSNLNQKN
jgi:hypothetical protein